MNIEKSTEALAAAEKHGASKIALACQVTPQAVRKWFKKGRLPRTEWTGETQYALKLEKITDISRHEFAPGAYRNA